MYSKTLFVVTVVCFFSDSTNGQTDNKFFREDYTYIEKSKSFYKIHTKPQTWANAKRACAQEGASLFYPENSDEVDAVISFWNRTQPDYIRVYVGMSELWVRGVFETIDGKQLSEVFNKWVPGEPNHLGGVEHCVNLYKEHGAINDCPCDILDPFICKKSLQSLEWNYQCNMPYLDYYPGEGTSKCYKLHTKPLTWIEAYNMCRIEESSLVMINNQLEADFLANFTEYTQKPRIKWNYQRGIYHLGFHNRYNGGWQTVKGTPINLEADAWWDDYQPEAGDPDDCGAMFYTGRLINISCETKSFFICEHDVDYSNLPQEENLFQ